MAKKRTGGDKAPATPAVPDPPVPNRARTEMAIGDPPERARYRDPAEGGEKRAPERKQ
ncbi:MAG: hypothetical protein IJF73_05070 [Clostridia bacterium]|nr:hypothetical protein [Clostridia bacterium]